MLWSVHLCFPFLSDVLPFRAYHSLIIPIGTPHPPPPPMMLLKASGTESPYLPTCCQGKFSLDSISRTRKYSENLGRQLHFGGLTSSWSSPDLLHLHAFTLEQVLNLSTSQRNRYRVSCSLPSA